MIIKNQPFINKYNFYFEVCIDIMTQIFFLCVLALAILDSIGNKDITLRVNIGWVCVVIIMSLQYFGSLVNLVNIILFCFKKIRRIILQKRIGTVRRAK